MEIFNWLKIEFLVWVSDPDFKEKFEVVNDNCNLLLKLYQKDEIFSRNLVLDAAITILVETNNSSLIYCKPDMFRGK